jgi:uncharacterized SAM-binding protein YcdF (DUF218 family)
LRIHLRPMFFILSKLLLVFILPLTWVLALLGYAVFTKNNRRKQKTLIITIIIFWFFGNQFTASIMANIWDIAPYKSLAKTYSAVILLGGFVSEYENGEGHFNAATDRFTTATNLLANGTAKHLLFSGGNADINPDKFNEARFVGAELKKLNIADSLVLLDSMARNTAENALYSKALLQKAGLKPPYLLVTSAYHMRRATLIYKKAGLDVVPYPCHYITRAGTVLPTDIIPGAEAFGIWSTYFKEMAGYVITGIK